MQEKKMAIFTNQATLSYNGRLTNSNTTTGELIDSATVSKTALVSSYSAGDTVAYVINIVNSGATVLTGVEITDNLGAYTIGAETPVTLYPLDYTPGSVKYFVNGVEATAPTVTAGPPLTISDITVPPNSNVAIIYEAVANEYAPLDAGATILNTATVTGVTAEPVTATVSVSADNDTELTMAKAICPAVVSNNGELTYTFVIQNSGNTAAVATDNVTVTDIFNPILNPISVTYNGAEWTEGVNYTYDEATGTFTTLEGQISIPAATYTQDADTGVITTTPGVAVITVTGTV